VPTPSPHHNAGGWLARRAATTGERTALIEPGRQFTYSALDTRAARFAGLLRARGIRRGDRVALLLGNRSAFLEAVFGTARVGAIALPLNIRLAAPEIHQLLSDAEPSLLLHEGDLDRLAREACRGLDPAPARLSVAKGGPDRRDPYEEALAEAEPDYAVEPVTTEDPMILMYTSGTTGIPKGALLPHRKSLFNSLNAQLFFDLRGDDVVLVMVPLFHSFGLQILSMPALYAGATIVLHRTFEPAQVWETVRQHRITFFGAVPTMFRALHETLEAHPGAWDLSSLRFAFTAGSAIPVELIHAFQARGLVLKQGFGQTETSILCCLDAGDVIRKAGSVGRPVFHAEVRVVDTELLDHEPEAWRDVPPGKSGEIVVRGPITMIGYWRKPEATAETLRGEWLRTGDLATVDEEGFVTLVGRARDMYISGGENVYPAQIEQVYSAHPALREIAVTAIPDPRWGETGCAFVVPEAGVRIDPEALRSWGRERLASFKVPTRFEILDELPKTVTGKIQKHRLPLPSS